MKKPNLLRRRVLVGLAAQITLPGTFAQAAGEVSRSPPLTSPLPPFAPVAPGYRLSFARDHGAHPDFRTEWWYITGWLQQRSGERLGFQITFFRTRNRAAQANPSAFAPHQVLIAHSALADPRAGHLLHDERIARQGFGLAGADTQKTQIWIDDWSLAQQDHALRATIPAREFAFELVLDPTQAPLLHGSSGLSRKGMHPDAASYYYSLPHLAVAGTIARGAASEAVSGSAWLDHEWSSSYLEAGSVGWDWIGINADDGGALMAFRMRDANGASRWAGATHRDRNGVTRVFGPGEISFVPRREWRSPRTGVRYPVAVEVSVADIQIAIEPLLDDQEIDARRTTGTVYWEGAVRAERGSRPFGRGYLELTGYWQPLRL